MKTLMAAVALLVAASQTGCLSRGTRGDTDILLHGSYPDSQRAWHRLEKEQTFKDGMPPNAVVAILGKPDLELGDARCYKTGSGPLWFEFSRNRLIGSHHVSAPPRWRGTDQEAEALWKRTRDQDSWHEW